MSAALLLHYFPTPNGWKASIASEEMGLPYELRFVDIMRGEQHGDAFRQVSPNGRIPALEDRETGARVFESGAILQYLGRKSGRFYPSGAVAQAQVDSWLHWQMAGLGPMTGQVTWFRRAAQKPGRDPADTGYAIHRFEKEMRRLYDVLEARLSGRQFLCDAYSIADMACWPWVHRHHDYLGELARFPNIKLWHSAIAERPAVQRAIALALPMEED